jgi:hypothetical protein
MGDDGRTAANAVIEALMSRGARRCGTCISIDVGVWDYSGKLIGYGAYDYSNSKGPAGRWFSIGIANRKAYISLYAMGTADGRYLVETIHDRFPSAKIGRSCINITKPDQIDDDAVRYLARESWDQYKDGFHRPIRAKAT